MPPRKKINVENVVLSAVASSVQQQPAIASSALPTVIPTALASAVQQQPTVIPAVQDPPIVVKQKRERKSSKHPVVAVVSQNGIQGIFQPEIRRPLIAHLPITSNEVKFYNQPLHYDPNPPTNPEAYDANMTNPLQEVNDYESQDVVKRDVSEVPEVKEKEPIKNAVVPAVTYPQNEYGPTTLLVQFAKTKETKELPLTSKAACFWCCEIFGGRPCVIPTCITEGVWQVYGNFCTPHCASAYLLADLLDTHVRWERLSLLHRLYGNYCGGRIYPSPHRECLERFGGPMSTQEFRRLCEERKIRVDVHLPPMVSILASMDTRPIDFYETSIRNTVTYSPVSAPSAPTDTTNLKLKRSKPLKDRESTLDACLNINFMGAS